MIVVSLGSAHVSAPGLGESSEDAGTVKILSLYHIVKIEPLAPAAAPQAPGNGSTPPGSP